MKFGQIPPLCLLLIFSAGVSEENPDPHLVESEIVRAVETMRSDFSSGGGYASTWTLSPFSASSEHRTSATVISIQPPGTTTLGRTFLRIYRITGNPVALEAAKEVADCLSRCQLSSGGWHGDFDPAPEYASRFHFRRQDLSGDNDPGRRRHRSTLDDNKTQSALLFLLDWFTTDDIPRNESAEEALNFGLEALLSAQYRNGGWPQQFDGSTRKEQGPQEATIPKEWPREWPDESYYALVTLNDGNLFQVLKVLLRAEEWQKDGKYLASARELGEFLLRAQLPEPQPGWAQQYNERMEPAWARKFEPPAVSSIESYSALETLYELWITTGDTRYRDAIYPALGWLETSVLETGSWARFYELGTNRPIYTEADTYKLTYDSSNLPTHYGFLIDPKFGNKLSRIRETLESTREEILQARNRQRSPSSWAKKQSELAPRVRIILNQEEKSGIWSEMGKASAKVWGKNLETLCDYLEAAAGAKAL